MNFNQEEQLLPKIRQDLRLLATNPSEDGSKQWLLFDPIANKYFTISEDTFDLISHWQGGLSLEKFLKRLNTNSYDITKEELEQFISFLINNNLIKNYTAKDMENIIEQKKAMKHKPLKWMIHNYLFIKVPLFKPDKWLDRNLHKINFLYSSLWSNLVLIFGFIGMLMVLQRWDEFTTTFMYLFSKEGFFYYMLSLVFVKSLHELGHAFTSKRYGCKVPSMGVAFLVMFPVLYTDSTNAYAINSKYKRLQIALAGMKVELYLALIATFLWSFLPDGSLKSIVFIIATTSWITSLLVNISPFLRFDGYYVLSDITNTKNLQPRSFAMARWFLRYYLLGIDETLPEDLNKSKKRFFITYAILTWIYRFFLFLGIAVLVYHFAFKVLGIILFVVEILWFILLPIYKELKVWWKKKDEVSWNKRNKISFVSLLFMLFICLFPWSSKIYMPAIVEASKVNEIYASKNSFIKQISVKNGQNVKKDELLFILESEDLEYDILKAENHLVLLEYELNKIASDQKLLEQHFIIKEELKKVKEELKGYLKIKEELIIKAPFDGTIYLLDNIDKSQWINKNKPIAYIYDSSSSKIIAFSNDRDVKRLKNIQQTKFIANNPEVKTLNANIQNISNISLNKLEYKELSSTYKGSIATKESQDKTDGETSLITQEAYFKIEASFAELDEELNIVKQLKTRTTGELIVEAQPQSIAEKAFLIVYNVLIEESEF